MQRTRKPRGHPSTSRASRVSSDSQDRTRRLPGRWPAVPALDQEESCGNEAFNHVGSGRGPVEPHAPAGAPAPAIGWPTSGRCWRSSRSSRPRPDGRPSAVLALRPASAAEAEVPSRFVRSRCDRVTPRSPRSRTRMTPSSWSRFSRPRSMGQPLERRAGTADAILTDDPWSTSMSGVPDARRARSPADLQFAQAYDPNQALDGYVCGLHGGRRRRDGAARHAHRGLDGRLPGDDRSAR